MAFLIDSLHSFDPPPVFGERFFAHALKQADPSSLLRLAPYLWRHVEKQQRPLPVMLGRIDSLVDEQPSAANTLVSAGLTTINRHRAGNQWFKRESDVPRLRAARSKTAVKLGLVVIPVGPDDPTYPIYQSQADWLNENEDSAWNLLDTNWDAFLKAHRELSFGYLMWTLRRTIIAGDSNQPDASILLGKVQLKLQKLMDANELEFGSSSSQDALVPGEKLKVTLNDPTLAVSGAGTAIEVVVWATSGGKETFFLRQFGDQKTKFRGEVATALGAPAPSDGTLQVIGDDKVFYAYAEGFRQRMNQQDEKRGGPITIASDSMLMASARKLLTEAEQRTADLSALMETVKDAQGVQQAAEQKMLNEREKDVADVRFAEDQSGEHLDTAGLDDAELKRLDKLKKAATPPPREKRERGAAPMDDTSLESMIGGGEKAKGVEVEVPGEVERPPSAIMSEADLLLAKRLDHWNLNLTRVFIGLGLIGLFFDYLRQANIYQQAT